MACPSSGLNQGPIHSSAASMTPSSEMVRPATIFLMFSPRRVVVRVGAMVGPLLTLRTDGSAMDTGGAKFFDELFISVKTASVHVSNILGKLGAATRGEAAATAHRLRLFDFFPP